MSTLAMMLSGGVAAPPALWPVSDLFADTPGTLLSAHSPVTGGTWVQVGPNDLPIPVSGRLQPFTSQTGIFVNAATPPSADYSVEADFEWPGVADGICAVTARDDGTGTNRYEFVAVPAITQLIIQRKIGGSFTQLAVYSFTATGTGVHTIKLALAGAVLTATIDGAAQTPVTDGSPITGAGEPGLVMAGAIAADRPICTRYLAT